MKKKKKENYTSNKQEKKKKKVVSIICSAIGNQMDIFDTPKERKKFQSCHSSLDQWAARMRMNGYERSSCYERVLTTNRLTLTFGVRGDSFVCEPSDSKRALRLLADSMLCCSPVVFWAISISAICWLLDVVFPSVSSQCSNFAHKVFARAAFCACFRNSSSTWNTCFHNFYV